MPNRTAVITHSVVYYDDAGIKQTRTRTTKGSQSADGFIGGLFLGDPAEA